MSRLPIIILRGGESVSYLESLAGKARYKMNKMARIASVSRRSVERHITRLTGQKPAAWLKKQRLLAAKKLLLKATSFASVASRVSFKQYSHFSREFKKEFGVTPSEFRLRAGKNI